MIKTPHELKDICVSMFQIEADAKTLFQSPSRLNRDLNYIIDGLEGITDNLFNNNEYEDEEFDGLSGDFDRVFFLTRAANKKFLRPNKNEADYHNPQVLVAIEDLLFHCKLLATDNDEFINVLVHSKNVAKRVNALLTMIREVGESK